MSALGTCVLTGASAGMGVVFADRLAKRGYDLVLVARSENRLAALAEKVSSQYGIKATTLKADLSKREDVKAVEDVIRNNADVTLVVNNAGMGTGKSALDESIDYLEDVVMELNVVSIHRLSLAAAQAFVARGKGALINLGSIASLHPEVVNPSYTAMKAFVMNLTEALYYTLKPKGIQVQCVLPGATRTEFFDRIGIELDTRFPPEKVMSAEDLVDAALKGFDMGEFMTIPSLPDTVDWDAYMKARFALGPNLSRNKPGARYELG